MGKGKNKALKNYQLSFFNRKKNLKEIQILQSKTIKSETPSTQNLFFDIDKMHKKK